MPRGPHEASSWGGLKTIFAQESKKEAFEQWNKVADALREKDAKLGQLMDTAREDVVAYMDFPKDHWTKISSTNPLERLNKEIKRRTDVVGFAGAPTPGSLPNDAALVRLVGALMLEQTDEWAVGRRYLSLESLAKLGDTEPRQLPAVAA